VRDDIEQVQKRMVFLFCDLLILLVFIMITNSIKPDTQAYLLR
jgi:hypothetical protein